MLMRMHLKRLVSLKQHAAESNLGSISAACKSLGFMLASTLGSMPAKGSNPANLNLSIFGSIPAKSLGSKPKVAAAELKDVGT